MMKINNWSDLTVNQYYDIIDIQTEFTSNVNQILELTIYLTEDDKWYDVSFQELIKEFNKYKFVKQEPKGILKNELIINDKKYTLTPFNKLTLAEWIDLDANIIDVRNNFTKILSLLYKQTKMDEWNNVIFEPYSYDLEERSIIFNECKITDVIEIIKEILEYRETILNNFKSIFGNKEDESLTEDEKEFLSEEEIREIENDIRKDNIKKDFGWQHLLDNASGGNWAAIPDILKLPHLFVFNMLQMKNVYSL